MRTAKTDQTGRMPRLIRVFAGHTLTFLVLSCCGSHTILTNKPELDKTNKMTMRPVKTQIALASAQSDQSLRCPHEERLGPRLPMKCTVKTLIRLGRCPD